MRYCRPFTSHPNYAGTERYVHFQLDQPAGGENGGLKMILCYRSRPAAPCGVYIRVTQHKPAILDLYKLGLVDYVLWTSARRWPTDDRWCHGHWSVVQAGSHTNLWHH